MGQPVERGSFLGRLVAAGAGAAVGGVVAAAVDAAYASGGVPSARTLFGELGLIAPLALLLGAGAGVGAWLLLPPAWPRLGALREKAQEAAPDARYQLAWRLILGGLGIAFGLVLVMRVALRLLANADTTRASGAAIALATVGVAGLVIALAFGGAALVGARRGSRQLAPLPVGAAVLALLVVAFAAAVASGTTSGAGSPLAVFGVFKREELDLRAPTLLLVVLAGALAVPALPALGSRLVALLVALAPLGALPYSMHGAFDRQTALLVERKAPLGKRLLAVAQRVSDRDRDGASAWFGGGDCAEGNAKIGPAADDVPGNGIDEDCSGTDAVPFVREAPKPAQTPEGVDVGSYVKKHLPENANVVLITIDATRAELGYAGYKRNISPNIDALAKQSAIFENAYSLASYTSKSLAPMLIGRYGSETRRGWLHFNRFPKQEQFLSERLQKAGIRTLSVQGHWYFFKPYGFERGYDVLDTQATPADQPIEGDKSSNGDLLSDRIIAALERPELENQRFFLWSHYIDPHAEYVAHEGFDFGHRGRERYDGEIAFVDHHFGRVLAALAKRPFAKRTIIIITSDHGEAFGEHDLYRHGFELWEELVRVPLVIHVPGAPPQRIPVRRSTIDVAPTVFEIFGLPPPAPDARDAFRGVSLLSDVLAPPGYKPTPRPIYIDMPAGPYNDERQAYIEDDMKLVTSGGRPLGLFDLAKDPGEKHDLADDRARVKPMLEKTKAFRRSLAEVVERP